VLQVALSGIGAMRRCCASSTSAALGHAWKRSSTLRYNEFGRPICKSTVPSRSRRQRAREGTVVAHGTVERLMGRLGLLGAMRGKAVRTTLSNAKAPCPLDRVNRQLRAERPNQLWVSDFTYVSTWQG
jgi:transposase InsO family protein